MKNKWFIRLFTGFVKLTGLLPALLFFKPRVRLADGASRRLPSPCIVVSNHRSLLDFVLYLLVFLRRTIRFLMAEVLYNKSSLFAWFLNSIGGIRVNRDDRDFSFVSDCLEVLDHKGTIGIFPQARLPVGGKPWPFTASTAFIAMHTDAPIVPVYTDGNYGLFKRAGVVIGKPFCLTDRCKEGLSQEQQLQHLTQELEHEVMSLQRYLEGGRNEYER